MTGLLDTTASLPPDGPGRNSPTPEVPGYIVGEWIGGGGFADVYRATEERLGREVAIKILKRSSNDPETLERWKMEGRLLARVKHDNVVTIFTTGLLTTQGSGSRLFLVMEYIKGKTLKEFMHEQKDTLSKGDRVDLIRQIASAVALAHGQSIYHRDLTPQNIMVVTERGEHKIKVLDFGIAAYIDGGDRKETEVGASLRYAAPEYIQAFEDMGKPVPHGQSLTRVQRTESAIAETIPQPFKDEDARADVYALGVIGWQLLRKGCKRAYQDPCNAEDARKRLLKAQQDTGIHDGRLRRIVMKATDLNPENRYKNASKFTDDLNNYLDFKTLSIDRNSPGRRTAIWLRRNRAAVALGSLLAIGVVGVSGWVDAAGDRLAEEQARTAAESVAKTEAEGRAAAEAARVAIAEEAASRQLRQVGFFRDSLRELSPYTLLGNPFTPETVLTGIKSHTGTLDPYPEAQAGVLQILGRTASNWGQQDKGVEWLRDAETAWMVAFDNADSKDAQLRISREQAANDNMLAWALFKRGDEKSKAEAFRVARRAYQRAEVNEGPEHETTLAFRFDAARLQLESGDIRGINEFFVALATVAGKTPNEFLKEIVEATREIAALEREGNSADAIHSLRRVLAPFIGTRMERLRGRVPWSLAQAGDRMARNPLVFFGFMAMAAPAAGLNTSEWPSADEIRALGRTAILAAAELARETHAPGHMDIQKVDDLKEKLFPAGSPGL